MSNLSSSESFERFNEGLLKAIDRCKKLSIISKNKNWLMISSHLEKILHNGKEIYIAKSITEQSALQMCDYINKDKARNNGETIQ